MTTAPAWFGLLTDHRRLLDACQDGWLRPQPDLALVLGEHCFAAERRPEAARSIPVRIAFEEDRLAFPDLRTLLSAVESRQLIQFHAPLPLSAAIRIEVESTGDRAHLLAMAGQFANVSLPGVAIHVAEAPLGEHAVPAPSPAPGVPYDLPDGLNAIQGAMTMAAWALPQSEQWREILRYALDRDAEGLVHATGAVEARWLHVPWMNPPETADPRARLWRAALDCLQWPVEPASPEALAETIGAAAARDGSNRPAEAWLARTVRIAAGDDPITSPSNIVEGTGLAIQLALFRPDPAKFETWPRQLAIPGVRWWEASILAGWRHGYRDLDTSFRGDAELRQTIAHAALQAAMSERPPAGVEAEPEPDWPEP